MELSGLTSNAIACLQYAVANGAKISNCSWGQYAPSVALRDAIAAAGAAGHIVVAAAGNDALNTDVAPFYPASLTLPNIISVAASRPTDLLWQFSNFGATSVDIAAPGESILSTTPTGFGPGYATSSGTSMSAPFVTGAIALLWSLYPRMTPTEIIARVIAKARPVPALAGRCVAGGVLDLAYLLDPYVSDLDTLVVLHADGRDNLLTRFQNGRFETWRPSDWWLTYYKATTTHMTDQGRSGERYFAIDVNGGNEELLVRQANGDFQVYEYIRGAISALTSFHTPFDDAASTGNNFLRLDVDGDGVKDFVTRDRNGVFQVWNRNGTTLVAGQTFVTGMTDGNGWYSGHRFFVMELDGDGPDELVVRSANGLCEIYDSNGVTLRPAGVSATTLTDAAGWNAANRLFVLDIQGDGRQELIGRDSLGSFQVWRSDGSLALSRRPSGWGSIYTDAAGFNQGARFVVMNLDGAGDELLVRHSTGEFDVLAPDFQAWNMDKVVGYPAPSPRSATPYGAGAFGTGGLVPLLQMTRDAALGTTTGLRALQVLAGAPVVFISAFEASHAPLFCGMFLVDLNQFLTIDLQMALAGETTRPVSIGGSPALVSLRVFWQAFVFDPAGCGGHSSSNGMLMRIVE